MENVADEAHIPTPLNMVTLRDGFICEMDVIGVICIDSDECAHVLKVVECERASERVIE